MIRLLALLMVVVCLLAAPSFAADARLEKGIALPSGLPDALKSALSSTGFRVINEAGAPYVEVWLAKATAGEARPANADVGYPGLTDGTFLGVWRYVGDGSDFRGQVVKAGLFTMRYGLMPQDANHLGAYPYRDFVLLCPIEADQTPSALLKWDEVVALSRKATGTNHPATYPMVPAQGAAADGVVVKNDQGHYFLKALVGTKSGGSIPIQLVVIGRGES